MCFFYVFFLSIRPSEKMFKFMKIAKALAVLLVSDFDSFQVKGMFVQS